MNQQKTNQSEADPMQHIHRQDPVQPKSRIQKGFRVKKPVALSRAALLAITLLQAATMTDPTFAEKSRYAPSETVPVTASGLLNDLNIPQLNIQSPPLKEIRLPSGALLMEAEDGSLPFVTLELYFHGGSSAEALDRSGTLRSLTSLMQIGGAGDLDGDAFAEAMSRMGARIRIDPGYENWSVSLTVLNRDFDRAYALLSDLLLRPRLPEDRFDVVKDSLLTDIQQRNDDPSGVARRKLSEIMLDGYRAGHSMQKSDIQRLKVEDLRADLNRRLRPQGMIIAASGDLKGLHLEEKLNGLIASFPSHKNELPVEELTYAKLSSHTSPFENRIVLVRFPAQQAVIQMGSFMPPHNNPDLYALQVGNYVLGGGSFNSRLMREVRAKRGLAYYSYSSNNFYEEYGRFIASSGTRVDRTDETLSLMLDIIQDIRNGVSLEELSLAKDSILNSLVFQYENPASFLRSEVRFRYDHMPEHYLSLFAEKVEAMDAATVDETMKKYIHNDRFFIVVVGPEILKEKLEKIRPVTVVDPEQVDFLQNETTGSLKKESGGSDH